MDEQTLSVWLTGRAVRWVRLLHDLGHLEPEHIDRLLVGVAELHGERDGRRVDLPEVRRVAAMLLFSELDDVLSDDWSSLFS